MQFLVFSLEPWEFPGSKVVCSSALYVFIVYVVFNLIMRFLTDLVLRSLVGHAFNGGYFCLFYLSLLFGSCNIRLL